MDDDYLEDYYDAIILSTGLGSSILAAALAKAGKSVLYLDCHEHYGQDTATFSFTQLLDWAEKNGTVDTTNSSCSSSSSAGTGSLADDNHGHSGSAKASAGNRNPAATELSSSFDSGKAGIAIARAHVRNERIKKEREIEEAAAVAAVAGETENTEVVGAGSSSSSSSSSNDRDTGGIKMEDAPMTKEEEQGIQQQGSQNAETQGEDTAAADDDDDADDDATVSSAAADAAAPGCPVPSEGISVGGGSSSSSSQKEEGEPYQQHHENREQQKQQRGDGDDGKGAITTTITTTTTTTTKNEQEEQEEETEKEKKEKAEAEKATDDAAATEERLQSLDLHLLPLSYHGCRTRAGAPSDACVPERRSKKAAEDAAAASGRFLGGRQPQPSHPAWVGRREPAKENGGGRGGGGGGRGGGGGGKREEIGVTEVGGVGGVEEGVEESVHPSFWGYRMERRPNAADLVRLSRSFNLDLTSQVLLATGPAVDALVDSGVSSYLEFKDMQALYLGSDLFPGSKEGGGGAGTTGRGNGNGSGSSSGSGNGSGGGSGSGSGSRETGGGSSINGLFSKTSTSTSTSAAAAAAAATARATATATATATGTTPGHALGLSRVPCSKADVFGTKLLTPLEKRRLMKFLLFASDWGLQRAGEDVLARNEAGLGRGRSLRRPQNREAASGDFGAAAYAGKPFAEFLRSCGLPGRVRAMITHALALLPGGVGTVGGGEDGGAGEEGGVTTEEGLEAVYRHLSALGRFGETAFITPLYGVGELSQSFCRMAAVHGAICMLRRQLRGAVIDRVTGRCVGVVDDAGRAFGCASLVVGGEFFDAHLAATAPSSTNAEQQQRRRHLPSLIAVAPSETPVVPPETPTPTPTPPLPPAPNTATPPSPPPAVASRTVIPSPPPPTTTTTTTTTTTATTAAPKCGATALPNRLGRRRLLRRIVLASGPVAPGGRGRGLCVLPPGLESVGNPAAVHVVSLDEGTAACPGKLDGACVIHLTTTMAEAFAAAASAPTGAEEEAGVTTAEAADGGSVCPGASASAGAGAGAAVVDDENGSEGVLGRAARELIAAAGVEEIWSLGFGWDVQEPLRTEDLPPNMVVCERPGQELYLHSVVVQAERAFARLCPGQPFWPPPSKDGQDGDDDQAEMLKAAASAVTAEDKDEDKDKGDGGEEGRREEGEAGALEGGEGAGVAEQIRQGDEREENEG